VGKKLKEEGTLAKKLLNCLFKKINLDKLIEYIKEHPDAYLREIAEEFGCCINAISKALKRLKIIRKKSLCYQEQSPEKVKEYEEKIKDIQPDRIVYIVKTGIDTYLYREYARAPIGKKAIGKIRGRKYQRVGIVASKTGHKIMAPFEYSETMNIDLFEGWFENCLLPVLPKNAVIVMRNCQASAKHFL